jgi:glycosyltransferase involved in cell wall biosynthesis
MKVSANIITLNEEKNIARALKSLDWVDEIIIVDSGSTDDTIKICEEAGARVISVEWPGYVKAKNLALAESTGDWIISIDADEEVTPELKKEILKEIKDTDAAQGYLVPRKNHYQGKWIKRCGWYPDYQLRLWERERGHWVGGRVHESVQVEGRVVAMNKAINHFSYDSISAHLKTIDKYTDLIAHDKFDRGKKVSFLGLFFAAPLHFLKLYIIRGGFLDGVRGLLVSAMGAHYNFLKKAKLWELRQQAKKK